MASQLCALHQSPRRQSAYVQHELRRYNFDKYIVMFVLYNYFQFVVKQFRTQCMYEVLSCKLVCSGFKDFPMFLLCQTG